MIECIMGISADTLVLIDCSSKVGNKLQAAQELTPAMIILSEDNRFSFVV